MEIVFLGEHIGILVDRFLSVMYNWHYKCGKWTRKGIAYNRKVPHLEVSLVVVNY